jgi:hypothetical protein
MSTPSKAPDTGLKGSQDPNPTTVAAFSLSQPTNRERKTVVVGQKSPLLLSTPPAVTRALAFSHPFLLPLNKFVGLVSWSSGDPWESFLVVCAFWALVLYGEEIILWAGPVVFVAGLIAGMYSRRYSPLSTRTKVEEQAVRHRRAPSEGATKHQKSLDEIVDTLNMFTSRSNIMLDPLLQLTDFLSTQQSATESTTRPALTTLFVRILMILPIWIGLCLPPLQLITGRRVVLFTGTIILTWHSRPLRATRTILWRSLSVRWFVAVVTGLNFELYPRAHIVALDLPARKGSQHDIANTLVANSLATRTNSAKAGVRFTFSVYENQRRWLGLGWTSSMFAYERAPWTDEHLNPAPAKEDFKLPQVDGAGARWQWVPGSEWRIEGTPKGGSVGSIDKKSAGASEGWIYYDNKVYGLETPLQEYL